MTLDPNIRHDVIGDPDTARSVVFGHAAHTHVFKASDEDLEVLCPNLTPDRAARAIAELGPELVVVTRGAQGALALLGGGEITVTAPEGGVVDTSGAGDALMGALLCRLDRE